MKTKVLALVLIALAVCFPAAAQDSQELDAKTKQLVEKIVKASNVKEAALATKALFKTGDLNLIRKLKNVGEKGVAIRAAWEEVAFSGFRKEVRKDPFGSDLKNTCLVVKPEAVARFLGFVGGKLGIQLPSWWEQAVRTAYTFEAGKPIRPGMPKKSPYHYFKFDDGEIGIPKSMTFKKKGEGGVIGVGQNSMYLAPEDLNLSRMSGTLSEKRCFLAFHNLISAPFPLMCFDRQSRQKLWQTTVWDGGNIGGTGIWYEYVAVVDNGKSVFVFGSGTLCFFIEAFDCKTGRNEFRFASRYWDE
jgi:hypothetical protein